MAGIAWVISGFKPSSLKVHNWSCCNWNQRNISLPCWPNFINYTPPRLDSEVLFEKNTVHCFLGQIHKVLFLFKKKTKNKNPSQSLSSENIDIISSCAGRPGTWCWCTGPESLSCWWCRPCGSESSENPLQSRFLPMAEGRRKENRAL